MDEMKEVYEILGRTYADCKKYKEDKDFWFKKSQDFKKENEELKANLADAEEIIRNLKEAVKENEQEGEDAGDQW